MSHLHTSVISLESHFPCSHDSDCKENSFCSGNTLERQGLCVCDPGYVIQKNGTWYHCYREATELKDFCELDIQCQVSFGIHAECLARRCLCKSGTHFYKNYCYSTVSEYVLKNWPTCDTRRVSSQLTKIYVLGLRQFVSELGEKCKERENCLLKNNELAYCPEGVCACGEDSKPFADYSGEKCVPAVKIGRKCNRTSDCFDSNADCSGVCRCRQGYITNNDESRCLRRTYCSMHCRDIC